MKDIHSASCKLYQNQCNASLALTKKLPLLLDVSLRPFLITFITCSRCVWIELYSSVNEHVIYKIPTPRQVTARCCTLVGIIGHSFNALRPLDPHSIHNAYIHYKFSSFRLSGLASVLCCVTHAHTLKFLWILQDKGINSRHEWFLSSGGGGSGSSNVNVSG
jgi:predicted nucleic-acid-binding Zn-ribbon protein